MIIYKYIPKQKLSGIYKPFGSEISSYILIQIFSWLLSVNVDSTPKCNLGTQVIVGYGLAKMPCMVF
jgi:hypothetical protein